LATTIRENELEANLLVEEIKNPYGVILREGFDELGKV
jgi:hypothetical protein